MYNLNRFIEVQRKDYSKALEFYKKACELDNGNGCNNLGVLFGEGKGDRPPFRILHQQ